MHHRAKYSDDTVEAARSMYDDGTGPTDIATALGVPIDTVNDWIYYRTRAYTVQQQEAMANA